MGCDLRRCNFSTLFGLLSWFGYTSAGGYFVLCVLFSGQFSHHVKFYSFMFLHKIFTRVVCVNGKYPSFYMLLCRVKIKEAWAMHHKREPNTTRLVKLGPVQTPNFSWAEPNSNQGRPKLLRPAELIKTPILNAAELSSKREKCSFRSNCLQNALY